MVLAFTPYAERRLNDLLGFVQARFSSQVAEDVLEAIDTQTQMLLTLPHIGTEELMSDFGSCRKLVVMHRTIVLYLIDGDTIRILDIFDARSDWKKE